MAMRTPRLLSILLLSMAAVPALANESKGLPQLDPTWYASQIFWLAVHFVALLVIARTIILPRIAAALDRREGRIAGDLEQADRLNKDAQQAKQEYEASLLGARQQAQDIREKIQLDLLAERTAAERKLAEQLATQTIAAHERIAKASADMHSRVRDIAADISCDLIQKVAGLSVDKATVTTALGRVGTPALKEVA